MKIEVFKGEMGSLWFWRLKSRNGKIVAVGGEGYWNKRDVMKSLKKIFAGAYPIHVLD